MSACSPETAAGPQGSQVDGDLPIEIVATDKLKAMTAGPRWQMIEDALPRVSRVWNPQALGAVQKVSIDWQDDPAAPCTTDHFAMYSYPGKPQIFVCPIWDLCTTPGGSALFGEQGCFLSILHELGHVLGASGHAAQGSRPKHLAGPVMCGWGLDCMNPALTDYTDEDVRLICGDGGRGGRCRPAGLAAPPSRPPRTYCPLVS